ncbi:Tricarboxylate transport protein TctC [plant metagenome]|uniref:Tricarboxylate transport protein TctC n=1 Tax=plant metagenome TaxID=1297885 RepID=A0A484Q3B4_9ZZZZ
MNGQPLRRMRTLAAVTCLALAPAWAAQAAYPDRPITFVVGYAAGGATDILARLVAKGVSEELRQPVVVENRTGANSNIGAEVVARAQPDGYTIYVGSIANTINRTLYSKLNYDLREFAPVALLATVPNILVVNPKVPVKTVQEYIAHAKANPGKFNCASSGTGSSINMSCELFKMETKTNILHVPYRGSGPAVVDLLGGQVDSMFDNLPSSIGHVQAGKLRALAVTGAKRAPQAPDVPTMLETGIPELKDFNVVSWFGLTAPPGTPPEVVKTLHDATLRALKRPEIVQAYEKNGFDAPPPPNTPQTFAKWINDETERWGAVVRAAGLKAE